MKRIFRSCLMMCGVLFFAGCSYLKNVNKMEQTSLEFFKYLSEKNFDGCASLMGSGTVQAEGTNLDTLRAGMVECRRLLVNNLGENFKYRFVKATLNLATVDADSTTSESAISVVEVSNDTYFCHYTLLFDVASSKIIYVSYPREKFLVPNMAGFWLAGLIGVGLILFCILTLVKIIKSDIKHKWAYCLMTVMLCAPTITYSAMQGFSFKLLHIQLLFGVSFHFNSYMSSVWEFGIPIGALIARMRVNATALKKEEEMLSRVKEIRPDGEEPVQEPLKEAPEEIPQIVYKTRSYKTKDGLLTIEQELQNPNLGERVFLDGKPAPSDKYKIGFMSYVEVEDGIIIALTAS